MLICLKNDLNSFFLSFVGLELDIGSGVLCWDTRKGEVVRDEQRLMLSLYCIVLFCFVSFVSFNFFSMKM